MVDCSILKRRAFELVMVLPSIPEEELLLYMCMCIISVAGFYSFSSGCSIDD